MSDKTPDYTATVREVGRYMRAWVYADSDLRLRDAWASLCDGDVLLARRCLVLAWDDFTVEMGLRPTMHKRLITALEELRLGFVGLSRKLEAAE